MSKQQYRVKTVARDAIARSERLRGIGGHSTYSTVISSDNSTTNNESYNELVALSHTHINKAQLDALTFDADYYMYITQVPDGADAAEKRKISAGYADKAGTLADDSPVLDKLNTKLSRVDDDTAQGKITFVKAAQFGENYAAGLTGFGGKIGADGAAELDSLTLRKFLEVPELRYNRVEVAVGDKWSAPGAGIINDVDFRNKIITLKLEEGEIGTVAVGDICMGIYHSCVSTDNSTEDQDDSRGNRRFAGFSTVYFTVTEILDSNNNSQFRYELRPVSERWTYTTEPFVAMHFVAYGNFTNAERQTSRYETRIYQRYLIHVNDWEFTAINIAAQFGDLTNLSVHGLSMSGYSAYLNNIYMSGTIQQQSDGANLEYAKDCGTWVSAPGSPYMNGDSVWHNNACYISLIENNTIEPGTDSQSWFFVFKEGKDGEPGVAGEGYECFYRCTTGDAPYIPDNTQDGTPPTGWSISPISTSITYPTVWIIQHKKVNGVWTAFNQPIIYSRYAADGKPGADGKDGANGADGQNGLTGCVVRTSEWVAGVYYRNDTDTAIVDRINGIGYLDVVIIHSNANIRIFQAKALHNGIAATYDNSPTSANAANYWNEFNQMQPIYTPLILAENAVLKFAQGNQLLIQDANGNTVAGFVGGDQTLWIGGATYDDALSKFKVAKDGKMIASDADISGKINATSGSIGGFDIDISHIGSVATNDENTSQSDAHTVSLYDQFIKFVGNNVNVMIGSNVASATVGTPVLANFINHFVNSLGTNYGLHIDVSNGANNIAMFGNGNVVFDGLMQSYNYKQYTFTSNNQVHFPSYVSEKIVVKYNYSNCYFVLPAKSVIYTVLGLVNGINNNTPFAVDLTVIIDADSLYTGYIYGRNSEYSYVDSNTGYTVYPCNSTDYPVLTNWNAVTLTKIERSKGDSMKFTLVYNGSTYRAYMINDTY